ncbi:NUDIX domain-containing protein [Streptomyces sp. NPDC005921]|uniref:NUDIX domain-containing protein n=1 Tax=Streptomyces sp. NPDC005827 TaxID=3157070 RepID=UPI0033E06587
MPASPSPRFDRRIYLLLLDDKDRLMLCRACCSGWTVPQALLDHDADFKEGATRHLAERFHIENPRFGSVHGIHETRESNCWEHDQRTVSHVFIVRISTEESDSLQEMSLSHTRWGISKLRARHRDISPEGVTLLISGYVEGWLPDGPISLN